MSYKFLPPAAREVKEAAKYYEEKIPGLGFAFIAEVRIAIRRIIDNPEAWQPMGENLRRCRTARFSYGIIYTFDDSHILIISVMHLHGTLKAGEKICPDLAGNW